MQHLRQTLWLTPKTGELDREVLIALLIGLDWRKPESLRALARALIENQPRIEAEDLPDALRCAAKLQELAQAFEADPPMPSVDDLIARYVGSEIGDRTGLWVMDWDHWELIEACSARNLPSVQLIPYASPGAMEALAEALRQAREEDGEGGDDEEGG